MRKISWPLLLLFAFCFTAVFAFGQANKKIPIAIVGFVLAPNATLKNRGDVSTLQEIVNAEFVSRSKFTLLDRSKFEAVLKELKVQKSEEFLDSKVVAEGKLIGAQYIITGVVSEFGSTVVTTSKQVPDDLNKPLGRQHTITEQTTEGRINFAFQVIDVEKGSSVFSKAIVSMAKSLSSLDKDVMDKAICQAKRDIKNSITSVFPTEIQIISLEAVDKKGRAEKVLIDEGEESFNQNAAKADLCGAEVVNSLKSLFQRKKGVPLTVYEIEKIMVNGKEIIREKTVGKIEIDKVEGQTSVCNVKDGEKEIAERFKAGAKLLVKNSLNPFIMKYILLIIFLSSIISCSHKVYAPQLSNIAETEEGTIYLLSTGVGKDKERAKENAIYNALRTLLFQGVPASVQSRPMIEPSDADKVRPKVETCIGSQSCYSAFVTQVNDLKESKSDKGEQIDAKVKINLRALRTYLEQNKFVSRPFTL